MPEIGIVFQILRIQVLKRKFEQYFSISNLSQLMEANLDSPDAMDVVEIVVAEGNITAPPIAPLRPLDAYFRNSSSPNAPMTQEERREAARKILSTPAHLHPPLVLSSKASPRAGPSKRKAEANLSPVPPKKPKVEESPEKKLAKIQRRLSEFPGEGFKELARIFPFRAVISHLIAFFSFVVL